MNNLLFGCDLDNTLIHSYKSKREGDICIEWIKDKEQGYISSEVIEMIRTIKDKATIVPITTRSVEQYLRICWDKILVPKYAITTNGAILLTEDDIDGPWFKESENILEIYRDELDSVLGKLEKENDYIRCRLVDNMYVFSYCKEGVDISEKVIKYSKSTSLQVTASGKKLYFLPPEFNKGVALKRLCDRMQFDYIIAAGDSEIDIPMLEKADCAFCRKDIIEKVNNSNKNVFHNEIDLLESIIRIIYKHYGEG